MAQAPVRPRGFELPLASLAKRSIKKDAEVFALELAVQSTTGPSFR